MNDSGATLWDRDSSRGGRYDRSLSGDYIDNPDARPSSARLLSGWIARRRDIALFRTLAAPLLQHSANPRTNRRASLRRHQSSAGCNSARSHGCHVAVWSEKPIVNGIKHFAIAGKLRNCCLERELAWFAAVELRISPLHVAATLAQAMAGPGYRDPPGRRI
jgi:hypothetical protein